jgi:2-succinyl-6-hydroxy-2,4-cyclohexadiene-1-carboxylate synthase
MKRRRIDVGGLELAVEERGSREGEPVLILHGFTGCAGSMAGVAKLLARRFRTLSIDLVGHGNSDRPRALARYAMDDCVAQLRALLDRLDLERAHWLGYSMGGRAALAFAVAHPDCVARLLLVGASAGLADPVARAERTRADEALAERIECEGIEAFVDHWMALPLFASQKRLGDEALAAARSQRLRNAPHALASSLRGMGSGAQPALHDALGAVRAPVCLVVGDEDARFEVIARDLAARLPDARVERVAEAGHAAHLENPDAFARVATDFFEQEP